MNFSRVKSILGVSFAVSLALIGIRQIGGLEYYELLSFDQMLRLQVKSTPSINERIVIVEITENDIKTQGKWPLPDGILTQTLEILNQHQPVAIGLDLFRDLPVEPGNKEFSALLKNNNIIVPVCKVSNTDTLGVSPPKGIEDDRLGFANVMVDPGGIVRRGLIFVEPLETSTCQASLSLAFQLARKYLASFNFTPELTPNQDLKWGNSTFKRLSPNDGGYHQMDNRGYQILLNYELVNKPPRHLSLDDVLNNRFESVWLKDNIILIGVTAPSIDDAFYTPYSAQQKRTQKMTGVMIHAQLTSQIISVVLGENPLFWFGNQWLESLWILVWGVGGGIIVYYFRHPLSLTLVTVAGELLLFGGGFILFLQGGWLPLIPAGLSFFGSVILGLTYQTYQQQQQKEEIALQLQQQAQDIALLQALLKNKNLNTTKENDSNLTHTVIGETKPESEIKTSILTQSQSNYTGFNKVLAQRYKLQKILGAGGFGYAYLALDIQRPGNPECLVKQLQPASKDESFLMVARRLFNTEASILEKLGSHPQIPYLLAHFEEDNQFYLVEEFIPGDIFSLEIKNNSPFSEKAVIDFLREMLSILSYIHSQGVIHRDIKPSNIIRRQSDQRLVLIDFGAVKEIQPYNQYEENQYTIAIGTKGYTPPEQLAGQPHFSSDLYALGIIAIQALTGIPPQKLSRNDKSGEIEWHDLVNISSSLVTILDKMIRYHFRERYSCADLILKDLNYC
jgi:CHASE2 domain-containing sensor protein